MGVETTARNKSDDGLEVFQITSKIEAASRVGLRPQDFLNVGKKYGSFQDFYASEWTPERVSGRLLRYIHSGFEAWCVHQPDLTQQEQLQDYQTLIKRALWQGYQRALLFLGTPAPSTLLPLDESYELTLTALDHWIGSYGTQH